MHVANAFGVATVALLAKLNNNMQLTKANYCFSIFDDSNVNNISVDMIVSEYKKAVSFFDNHLQA